MMLTKEGCLSRRQRLFQKLPDSVAWAVVTELEHANYFSGFFPSPFVFNSQQAVAVLLLGRGGEAILIADNAQGPFSEAALATETVSPTWYRCVEEAPLRRDLVMQATLERLSRCHSETLGYEPSSCPVALFGEIQRRTGSPINIEPIVRQLKRSKDPDEVALLKIASAAGDAAHAAGLAHIKPGMTELQAYHIVQHAALEACGFQATVYGDFASGPRALGGGGPPTSRVIEPGDLVILDFSVICRGYRGDTANTFVCGGEPTPQQVAGFQACVAAMQAGEALLKPGQPAKKVFEAVHQSFAARGLESFFTHHAGHGLGLGHPDPPYLVPESDEVLLAGDVVTLEPGLYMPNVGGMRYEHNYLITPAGYERLSHHALQLTQT